VQGARRAAVTRVCLVGLLGTSAAPEGSFWSMPWHLGCLLRPPVAGTAWLGSGPAYLAVASGISRGIRPAAELPGGLSPALILAEPVLGAHPDGRWPHNG
jgi:hypothetical protein